MAQSPSQPDWSDTAAVPVQTSATAASLAPPTQESRPRSQSSAVHDHARPVSPTLTRPLTTTLAPESATASTDRDLAPFRSASAFDFGTVRAQAAAQTHAHHHAHGRAEAIDPKVYKQKFRAVADIPIVMSRLRSFSKWGDEHHGGAHVQASHGQHTATQSSANGAAGAGHGGADSGAGTGLDRKSSSFVVGADDGVRPLAGKKMSSTRIYAPHKNTKVIFFFVRFFG